MKNRGRGDSGAGILDGLISITEKIRKYKKNRNRKT